MTHSFISVNDHVQETPDVWTSRLSKSKWGDRIPQIKRNGDGAEHWVVDGQVLLGGRIAQASALLDSALTRSSRLRSEIADSSRVSTQMARPKTISVTAPATQCHRLDVAGGGAAGSAVLIERGQRRDSSFPLTPAGRGDTTPATKTPCDGALHRLHGRNCSRLGGKNRP